MVDREREYKTELTKLRHTNYVRNSRAIVVLWAVFSVVYLILNIVVFIQPQWIGDSGDSAIAGFFGLYRRCEEMALKDDYVCSGDFIDWDSMINSYFRACAVMVGVSCLLFIICVCCFFLFVLLNTATVLRICAWFQLLSGILMAISVIVFPAGWDDPTIQLVCGQQAGKYDKGICDIRWGYILAIVLVFDAFILCVLAFVLAAKQANLIPYTYLEKDKDTSSMDNFELRSNNTENHTSFENSSDSSQYQHLYDFQHERKYQHQERHDNNNNNNGTVNIYQNCPSMGSSADYSERRYVNRSDNIPNSFTIRPTQRHPIHPKKYSVM